MRYYTKIQRECAVTFSVTLDVIESLRIYQPPFPYKPSFTCLYYIKERSQYSFRLQDYNPLYETNNPIELNPSEFLIMSYVSINDRTDLSQFI